MAPKLKKKSLLTCHRNVVCVCVCGVWSALTDHHPPGANRARTPPVQTFQHRIDDESLEQKRHEK